MPRRKEKKWLVAKRVKNRLIRTLGYKYRYTTKAKAQKVASKLNKRAKRLKVEGVKFLVRRVGWRRKRWHS